MERWIKKLAPYAIVILLAVFAYNVYQNGRIEHPGKFTYAKHCSDCHGEKGEGIEVLVPPLMGADFAAKNPDSLACWIRYGINRPITVNGIRYDQPMYGVELDEIQIANLINYMNKTFHLGDKDVNSARVKTMLEQCR